MRAAAERLDLNNTGIEKARLADYIYEPRNPALPVPPVPEGWKDISDDPEALAKFSLKPANLNIPGEPGFRSRVYVPDENVFGKDMSASVVFAEHEWRKGSTGKIIFSRGEYAVKVL